MRTTRSKSESARRLGSRTSWSEPRQRSIASKADSCGIQRVFAWCHRGMAHGTHHIETPRGRRFCHLLPHRATPRHEWRSSPSRIRNNRRFLREKLGVGKKATHKAFYSNDHAPIHVHVRRGGGEAVFVVEPEGELRESVGFNGRELSRAEDLIDDHLELIK